MTRGVVIKWVLFTSVALAAGLIGYFWLRARTGADDPSIVLAEPFHTVHGLTIENGSAFDKAAVDVEAYTSLVLPDSAEVRTGEAGQRVQIYMKKTLFFGGHPPEPMSIRTARKNMGCAVKLEDGALVVATFGEWDSHKEGGASMALVFVVPEGKQVERRGNLSGPDSVGHEWRGQYLTKPREVKEGYWYGPATATSGWTAVPDLPDAERRWCSGRG
jgi:hypothetical protein